MKAVSPSEESATRQPTARPSSPPVSFGPCWVQVEPERVNTHAAPKPLWSYGPPIKAVSPSEERATLLPKPPSPLSSPPVSFGPCWVQVEPERVNTHAAPMLLLSPPTGEPIKAVSPSEERATPYPKRAVMPSPAVSFGPCWVQVEPERVNTHAAPMLSLSPQPPIRAVLPSEESATLLPKFPSPLSSAPVSFGPCWVQVEPERVNTHTAPALFAGPPIKAVLPSEESATLQPNSPVPLSSAPVSFGPCWMNGSIRSGYRARPESTCSMTRPPSRASQERSARPVASLAERPA